MRALILGLMLTSCTNIVEENPDMKNGNKSILSGTNWNNLGKTMVFVPATNLVAGATINTQDKTLIPGISAIDKWDSENISLSIDAIELPIPAPGVVSAASVYYLQGVLKYGAGSSIQGLPADPLPAGTTNLSAEITFDIQFGTTLTIAGAQYLNDLIIRYIAVKGAGFAAGDIIGPPFRISGSYAYGNITPSRLTSSSPPTVIANGAAASFPKPKFAQTCQVVWDTQVGNGMDLRFRSVTNTITQLISLVAPQFLQTTFPWPPGASFLEITNTGGAPALVTVINGLNL